MEDLLAVTPESHASTLIVPRDSPGSCLWGTGHLSVAPPSDDMRWKVQDSLQSHSEVLLSSLSFVVVDDVRATCEVIYALLRALGAGPGKVSICTSLALAKQRVTSGAVDVILGDLHLGDGSGLELLELIRNTPSLSDTIFMMITNDPQEEALERAKQLRVSSVLAKPLSFYKLQEHLLYCLLTQGVDSSEPLTPERVAVTPERELIARLSSISRKLTARSVAMTKKRNGR